MASNSVEEIIGGFDTGGGIPQDEVQTIEQLQEELWLQNLTLGVRIFALVAFTKIGVISAIWYLYFLGGTKLSKYMWWAWFSALISVYAAWGPVAVSYFLMVTRTNFSARLFFYASLASIIGPFLGYFVPIVVIILAYNARGDTGLTVSSELQFWLSVVLGITFNIASMMFELAFLPVVRIWFDKKMKEKLETVDETEEVVEETDGGFFEFEEPEPEPIEEDPQTTFLYRDITMAF